MKAYSIDLREKVLAAIGRGMPRADAAQVFAVSSSSIKRWLRRRSQTGTVTPSPIPGRPAVVGAMLTARLEPQLRAYPDATIAEHCAHWLADTGQVVSPTSMRRAIARLDWTRKKESECDRTRPGGACRLVGDHRDGRSTAVHLH